MSNEIEAVGYAKGGLISVSCIKVDPVTGYIIGFDEPETSRVSLQQGADNLERAWSSPRRSALQDKLYARSFTSCAESQYAKEQLNGKS